MTRILPYGVQRRIATFGVESGMQARRGDVLFGRDRRAIADDMGHCMRGICATSDSPPSTTCTLDGRVVTRQSTELCSAVCLSRYPARMLLKFIRYLVWHISRKIPREDRVFIRMSLQQDDADYDMGEGILL